MSDQNSLPVHIGFVLDGNRRWAREHNLPLVEGHRQGLEAFKNVSLAAFERGVKVVSAYIFSTENWKRTEEEVSYLMALVIKAVEKHLKTFDEAGIRLVHVGSREGVSQKVLDAIDKSVEKTKDNTNGTLALCFNYGGKPEIVNAVKQIVAAGTRAEDVSAALIEQKLYAPEIPPLDLLIRTSGEHRTSGFMMWRSDYAELMFVDKNWPDYSIEDLDGALEEYKQRNRRFGE